jgi:hypothetical protein
LWSIADHDPFLKRSTSHKTAIFLAKNWSDLPDGHFANASNLVRNHTRFIQQQGAVVVWSTTTIIIIIIIIIIIMIRQRTPLLPSPFVVIGGCTNPHHRPYRR